MWSAPGRIIRSRLKLLPPSLTYLVSIVLEGVYQVGDDLLDKLRVPVALPVGSEEILSCANSALHYILF